MRKFFFYPRALSHSLSLSLSLSRSLPVSLSLIHTTHTNTHSLSLTFSLLHKNGGFHFYLSSSKRNSPSFLHTPIHSLSSPSLPLSPSLSPSPSLPLSPASLSSCNSIRSERCSSMWQKDMITSNNLSL